MITPPTPKISELLGNTNLFLTTLLDALKKDQINVNPYELDHICYRVSTKERYEQYKLHIQKHGVLLSETSIGGRPISTYKLHSPIIFIPKQESTYSRREIYLLELPSPKQNSPYPDGLEHAEFVIPHLFEEFITMHPHIEFDTKDITKPINPDIRIKYSTFSVKFHHQSLEYVIKEEQTSN